MADSIYDQIVALPRGDERRHEIAGALGCHHLSTAMLRILKIADPAEKEQVTAKVRAILERDAKQDAPRNPS
jgi:hypothetical protein